MQEKARYHQRKGGRIRMAGKDQASVVQGELLDGQGGKAMVLEGTGECQWCAGKSNRKDVLNQLTHAKGQARSDQK